MEDKILGTLYGQALGDAMGMPSELWPRQKVQAYFGYITELLDGPPTNVIAKYFTAGQFTDDTAQALVILDALIETNFKPDTKVITDKLISWANQMNAFENEILGPSSKQALLKIKAGEDPKSITDKAETNGSAMRISPIGTLYHPNQLTALVECVVAISSVTHSSDCTLGGACAIAGAVSSAMVDESWDEIINTALKAHDLGFAKGAPTYAASIPARTKLGVKLAKTYKGHDELFLENIYQLIGSGVIISESVPAALSIAYYSKDANHCAELCANLGGDTDTIGAMATAICGAKEGMSKMSKEKLAQIKQANTIDFQKYVPPIQLFRQQ